jgi:hypothetical protein
MNAPEHLRIATASLVIGTASARSAGGSACPAPLSCPKDGRPCRSLDPCYPHGEREWNQLTNDMLTRGINPSFSYSKLMKNLPNIFKWCVELMNGPLAAIFSPKQLIGTAAGGLNKLLNFPIFAWKEQRHSRIRLRAIREDRAEAHSDPRARGRKGKSLRRRATDGTR